MSDQQEEKTATSDSAKQIFLVADETNQTWLEYFRAALAKVKEGK